jgi:hypothetical protein
MLPRRKPFDPEALHRLLAQALAGDPRLAGS